MCLELSFDVLGVHIHVCAIIEDSVSSLVPESSFLVHSPEYLVSDSH